MDGLGDPDPINPCTLLADPYCAYVQRDAFGVALAIWDLLQLSWIYVLVTVQVFQIARGVTTQELHHLRNDRRDKPQDALTHPHDAQHGSCPHNHHHRQHTNRSVMSRLLRIVGFEQALMLFSGRSKRVRVVNPYDRGIRRNCEAFWSMNGSVADAASHEEQLV